MSDDFDKEAERERLREKYGREKEDRQATERMSELLLQGATMTNRHCDTCGSPIFRYQGQEFCPNCQVATGAEAAAAQESRSAEPASDSPVSEDSSATGEHSTADGQAAQPTSEGTQDSSQRTGQPPARRDDRQPATRSPGQSTPQAPRDAGTQESGATTGAGSTQYTGEDVALDENTTEQIRASLTQTLATFAKRAAQTDDPHRAREFLKTAKTAAETLRSLPR
ncbi:MAG: Sjogren's syndrome/scleroderma autoantigen 1 family protein [Halanaeroarchaeum sp.]